MSFRAGRATFILVPLHVTCGKPASEPAPELRATARWMRDRAKRESAWSHNPIAPGDFNIDRHGDALWQAFTPTGLTAPETLNAVPRTIFADPARPALASFHDQIARFGTARGVKKLAMEYRAAGNVDVVRRACRDQALSWRSLSFRIPEDHFPLRAEFAPG